MAPSFHIDSFTPCGLVVEPMTLSDHDAVVALIRRPGTTGWVQTAERVSLAADFDPTTGAVLAAELVTDASASIHIRRAGSTWRVWTYSESTGGQKYRAETVRRLGIGAVQHLEYRVYWEKTKPNAFESHGIEEWRPSIARLVSIELLNQESA